MEAVIAGWAAGYVMSLLCTAALVYLAMTSRDGRALERFMPGGLSPLFAAVPISMGMALGWTLVGTAIGAGFAVWGPEEASPPVASGAFLASMGVVSTVPLAVLMIFWPARWWLWVMLAASFALLFGAAMPLLATR